MNTSKSSEVSELETSTYHSETSSNDVVVSETDDEENLNKPTTNYQRSDLTKNAEKKTYNRLLILSDTESDEADSNNETETKSGDPDERDAPVVKFNEESGTKDVSQNKPICNVDIGGQEELGGDTEHSIVPSVPEHSEVTSLTEAVDANKNETEASCYVVSSDEDTNEREPKSENSKPSYTATAAASNVKEIDDKEIITIEDSLVTLNLNEKSIPTSKGRSPHDNTNIPPVVEAATNKCDVPNQQGVSRKKLQSEIDILTQEVLKLKKILMTVDINGLPDRGVRLQMKLQDSEEALKGKRRMIATMPETGDESGSQEAGDQVVHRLPKGFGVKALQTEIREKTLTEEALQRLHGSINTCPAEDVLSEDPKGLKRSVTLMPHQKHALAWMAWREKQKPRGGILADDMGLGKTLTMISLVLKDKEERGEEEEESSDEDSDKEEEDSGWFSTRSSELPKGGTLVVCPASLLMQWADEIQKHCRRSVLEVEIFHGSNREKSARLLAKNDIVVTTFSIVRTSCNNVKDKKGSILHRINWDRIILDEAHVVRNHKSQQSVAVYKLRSRRRWALTGTPIHNKELDLYALLKFLRCSPFDDYNVWRRWVDNKNAAGIKRLNTVINSIMLRRTKESLTTKGQMTSLPKKTTNEVEVHLDKQEYSVYTQILAYSKTLFAQFLGQRAEKEELFQANPLFAKPAHLRDFQSENPFKNNPELARMFQRMNQIQDIKTHQILVLLLRLRQICCHPGLIKSMIEEGDKKSDGIEESDGTDMDLLSQLGALSLEDANARPEGEGDEEVNVLTFNNPVFKFERASSKMRAVFEVLEEKVLGTTDKAVVVSQWTSMLNIVKDHLFKKGVKCRVLSGEVPVKDRMDIVRDFNEKPHGFRVLLLSLAAGGVGLNLVGGNHLFLIDLHWNPQLENQAFDRVYRYGQTKPVYVYKFICQDTIEQKIRALQEKKMSLAEDVLSGTMKRSSNKLTLEDLKSLFSM